MLTNLNPFDAAKQKLFPTIMVPQRSELPPCNIGQTRLLMAADGCYLETRTAWGQLTKLIMPSPRKLPLPYGIIDEVDTFTDVLNNHVIPLVTESMITEASRFAEAGKEWAGFIVYDGTCFISWADNFDATRASVDFTTHSAFNLPNGYSLVADIHSHGTMSPFFSSDDNRSDLGKIKVSLVLGNYKNEGASKFDWKTRFCVQGFFFEGEETLPEGIEMLNLLRPMKRGDYA